MAAVPIIQSSHLSRNEINRCGQVAFFGEGHCVRAFRARVARRGAHLANDTTLKLADRAALCIEGVHLR
jgi:hypothetical protein